MKERSEGNPFLPLASAVAVLFVLSFIPWGALTGNFLKDFNLLEDISLNKTSKAAGTEIVDPELEELLAEHSGEDEAVETPQVAGGQSAKGGTLDLDGSIAEPAEGNADKSAVSETAERVAGVKPEHSSAPRQGDVVLIEDFSPSGDGLARFKSALSGGSRPARIAMIGDSYIEGDILSQDIREGLQEAYGGSGVGFVALHSDIPGFRYSVNQSDSGWTMHDIRKTSSSFGGWLAGTYATGSPGAKSTFKGTSKFPHSKTWGVTTFLFVAPNSGELKFNVAGEEQTFNVEGSDEIQAISIPGETTSVTLTNSSVEGLVGLGLWLEGSSGVSLDCMSLRGNSGVALRKVNADVIAGMRRHLDYDLIILEYGMNAISSQQEDYSSYTKVMEKVVASIRDNYPEADILLMGVGDRGQKIGSEVHSLLTIDNMVDNQRALARKLGVMFWDTREAMGGRESIVEWRKGSLVNADYIHLNHKGGGELGRRFVESMKLAMGQ